MRAAIIAQLVGGCTLISNWWQPFKATADTPKPYGVVKIGTKTGDGLNSLAAYRAVEIWPYFDRAKADFDMVDAAVRQIRAALKDKTLTTAAGDRFTLEFTGEGQDYRDDALDALTRPVYFRIPGLM